METEPFGYFFFSPSRAMGFRFRRGVTGAPVSARINARIITKRTGEKFRLSPGPFFFINPIVFLSYLPAFLPSQLRLYLKRITVADMPSG
jgi:hypothetical protein